MPANDRQVGGKHYKTEHGLEHWDMVDLFGLDYFQGQITKYVMRWRLKGGIGDLSKARHFLDKYIELEEKKLERKRLPKTQRKDGVRLASGIDADQPGGAGVRDPRRDGPDETVTRGGRGRKGGKRTPRRR